MSNVGARIVQLRLNMGIKITTELAERVGMVKSTVTNYENGVRNVPIEAMTTFAEFFDVSLDYLACRTDFKGSFSSLSDVLTEFDGKLITKEDFLNDIDKITSVEDKRAMYRMIRALIRE